MRGSRMHLSERLSLHSAAGDFVAANAASISADTRLMIMQTWNAQVGRGAVSPAMQTLTEGSEWKQPNQGASVKAHVVGRLQDGTVFEDADLDFVTDEGEERGKLHADIPDALQRAVFNIVCKVGLRAILTMASVRPMACGKSAN